MVMFSHPWAEIVTKGVDSYKFRYGDLNSVSFKLIFHRFHAEFVVCFEGNQIFPVKLSIKDTVIMRDLHVTPDEMTQPIGL